MDTTTYKQLLLDEKQQLETDLGTTGLPNPDQPGEWQPTPSELDDPEYRDEIADRLETLEQHEATEANLQKRLSDINRALDKIEAGTFGICEVGGETIETDRLSANPAARTCKAHLEEEDTLV